MEYLKWVVGKGYWICLLIIAVYATFGLTQGTLSWNEVFHLAYYLPPIAMLLVISGQFDLLLSMKNKGQVSLKARMYDFVHWLMLIALNVTYWLNDGVTPWWLILKLILLAIIGWQIGVGIKNKLQLTTSDKMLGITASLLALMLGVTTGYIRTIDQSALCWGWGFESITAVVATLIVIKWITDDLKVIKEKASGYPRSFFLKGIPCNFLILWFWAHIISRGDFQRPTFWLENFGLTFNALVGNVIYLIYYIRYEQCRSRQK